MTRNAKPKPDEKAKSGKGKAKAKAKAKPDAEAKVAPPAPRRGRRPYSPERRAVEDEIAAHKKAVKKAAADAKRRAKQRVRDAAKAKLEKEKAKRRASGPDPVPPPPDGDKPRMPARAYKYAKPEDQPSDGPQMPKRARKQIGRPRVDYRVRRTPMSITTENGVWDEAVALARIRGHKKLGHLVEDVLKKELARAKRRGELVVEAGTTND